MTGFPPQLLMVNGYFNHHKAAFHRASDGNGSGFPQTNAVAFGDALSIHDQLPADDKYEHTLIQRVESVGELLPFLVVAEGDSGVLVYPAVSGALFIAHDGHELVFTLGLGEAPLLIAWRHVLKLGFNPDL